MLNQTSQPLVLRPYQKDDVALLTSKDCTACFNEQRTGKTPTALMCIKARNLEDERVLIITTASTLYQWKDEYERWLNRECLVADGTREHKEKVISEWRFGLVISLDSLKSIKEKDGYEAFLLKKKPTMVILDEAHHIRNPKTYSAKAVFKFTKVKYRLALTGTPAYGEQKDIFSILHFLYPDQFKTIYKFQDEYMVPEQYVIYVAGQRRCFTEYHNFYPQATKRLTSFLKTISTNRKRSEVMQWLPEKDRQTIRLPATEKQKEALTSLRDNFTFGEINTVGVLDRLVRYRQVCLFPESLGIKEEGPKVSWILDHIKENPGTPIIVFSLFSSFLRYLSVLLRQNNQKFASILGEVPPKVRKTFTDDFQSGKFDIFLINIMAGKEGLTLDRAEEIIFADLYPPIGNIEQAEDRFIATTKDKADKPHTIYNLVIADTFDEDMLKLLQQRKTETDIINCFKKGESK